MDHRLPVIPVLDVREGGPTAHAHRSLGALLELRDTCFSVLPPPLRGLIHPLDRMSAAWLRRTPSPYVGEIEAIARMADRPGVWFVNASYEWGCTTRVDAGPVPFLRRTLDWPFPGLGRHVEVALQDGGAGPYANVTWPGAAGVLTGLAPGRFAAAINQGPMYRRSRAMALLPADFLLNGTATWRMRGHWPVAHLLRHAFDTCATFEEAVVLLTRAPIAKPTLISIVGAEPGQSCLIERTETDAFVHQGTCAIANDWHPEGPARPGQWLCRGAVIRGVEDSSRRRERLEGHRSEAPLDWLDEPVLNGLTRLAVEASPATGELRVLGFEPTSRSLTSVRPATSVLEVRVSRDGVLPLERQAA